MSCYHGPCHHRGDHGYGPGYGCHHGGHGYGAGNVYGPPPGQPVARRGGRARDLEDYADDLAEELARVRRDLQEQRRAETPEG